MLGAALSLVLNYFIKFPTFPDEALARFSQYCDRRLPLQVETSDALTLSCYFAAEGIPFADRTLDPAVYTLKGGRSQQVLNRKSSWCAYQGQRNNRFVFQMHPGSLAELPAGEGYIAALVSQGVPVRVQLYRWTSASMVSQ